MAQRAWLITGVSSGLRRELTSQLLERGDRVIGAGSAGLDDREARIPASTDVPED